MFGCFLMPSLKHDDLALVPDRLGQRVGGQSATGNVVRRDEGVDGCAVDRAVHRDDRRLGRDQRRDDGTGGVGVNRVDDDAAELLGLEVLHLVGLLGGIVAGIGHDKLDAGGVGRRLCAVPQRHEEGVVEGGQRQTDADVRGLAAGGCTAAGGRACGGRT
jgi:hypothetical protein